MLHFTLINCYNDRVCYGKVEFLPRFAPWLCWVDVIWGLTVLVNNTAERLLSTVGSLNLEFVVTNQPNEGSSFQPSQVSSVIFPTFSFIILATSGLSANQAEHDEVTRNYQRQTVPQDPRTAENEHVLHGQDQPQRHSPGRNQVRQLHLSRKDQEHAGVHRENV